jgi:PKD repeat protein
MVTITDVLIAGLTAVNNSPTSLGSATTLTASVTSGMNVSYTWNFGDGLTGNGSAITHSYLGTGTYTAVVTARNATNSLTATTIVTVQETMGGLTAVSNSPTILGETTTLSATIAAGSQVSYMWQLGDGTTSYGSVVTHNYSSARVYTATVTATNAVSTMSATIHITIATPVQADFVAVNQSGMVPLTAVFNNTSSGDYDSSLWHFGDGSSSTKRHPSHTYTSSGTYTVTLTISGIGGTSTLTRTAYIIVLDSYYAVYLPLIRSANVP